MMIPGCAVHAVRQLCHDRYTGRHIGGGVFSGYYITRGIKQGCPLSGILDAIAADQIFRCLLVALSPLARPLAFAGDIGIVSANLVQSLPVALRLLSRTALVTGLVLNPGKCSLIFAVPCSDQPIRAMFRGPRIRAPKFRVNTCCEYLGVYIAPNGPLVSWDAPGAEYINKGLAHQ
eukprot:4305690-Pyramimonas_sp.AAC.1